MDIGFQLYSARNFPLAEVITTIAELGYKNAEGYGSLYTDPKALKAQLDAAGLKMPTAHISLGDLEKPDATMKTIETLDIKVVVCPWLAPEERPTTADGWKAFGDRLQKIAKPYKAAGLDFGYHNHDFEFARYGDAYAMDLLLAAAGDLSVEADVAWIVRGGADPKPWLESNGSRIVSVHVKDIAPKGENADEDGWADVGQGIVPWKDLMATVRGKTSARYLIAEHDNPKDFKRFARRSIEAIRSYGV